MTPRPAGLVASFLIWMALLDQPMEVLGPPELAAVADTLGRRLTSSVS